MYINKIVTKTSTPAVFLEAVVNMIAATSDKFSVDDNVITIDSKYQLTFTISGVTLMVAITYNNVTIRSSTSVASVTNVNTTGSISRSLGFFVAENDNCINLKFFNYNSALANFSSDFVFAFTDNDVYIFAYYASVSSGQLAINQTIYNSADPTQTFKIPSRLSYIADDTVLDIDNMSNKILLSGTQKADTISAMLDCSTVTPNVVYPCTDGKEYYALNANTLMEV